MLFNSGNFLIFFPAVVLIYFALPKKAKNVWLIISSYFYYMCWNPKYAILLFGCSLVTYIGGLLLEKTSNSSTVRKKNPRKLIFLLVLILCLLVLFYYKYLNFTLHLLEKALRVVGIQLTIPAFDIILPVGISFFTFQALGYLIDVYRKDIPVEKNVIKYFLFISFFPQLLSGPIGRAKNLLCQFDEPKFFDTNRARDGLLIMLWGFFIKLVIADRCSVLVNTVYSSPYNYIGIQLVLANIFFALQIYCDFMGYSTIARGAALVLGINLIDNFKQPYFASSVKNFWRRWHISLSSWLRDYVYISLGGSRCSKLKKYRNILLTFFVSGLWHGANLTFVAWGMIHGIFQVIEDVLTPAASKTVSAMRINTSSIFWKIILALKTFILVSFAWIFFRADSLRDAFYVLINSFRLSNIDLLFTGELLNLGLNSFHFIVLTIAVILLLVVSLMREKNIRILTWLSEKKIAVRYVLYWLVVVMIIFSMNISGQEFLYLKF